MTDEDVCPFDPSRWTVQWLPAAFNPKVGPMRALLTAPHGSRIVLTPGFLIAAYITPPPIWWVRDMHGALRGWLIQSPNDDPLGDIARAVQRGDELLRTLQSLEIWVLEQGLLGGSWTYQGHDKTLWEGRRSLSVPEEMYPLLASMVPMARFEKTNGNWYLLSGTEAAKFTQPATRHGVLARLAELRTEVPS